MGKIKLSVLISKPEIAVSLSSYPENNISLSADRHAIEGTILGVGGGFMSAARVIETVAALSSRLVVAFNERFPLKSTADV
jgi:hypothetical protein